MLKAIISQFNFMDQCKKYGLSLWQCPQFLFMIMGIIIIASIVATYFIGNRFVDDPQIVALIVLFITLILFVIAMVIVQSFERLAETSRLKSEFVSVVSHQLRSPLSNLKWSLEFLMSGRASQISEKQLEYFKILKENNDRMVNLVADLLTVSRIQQGRLFTKEEEISLTDIAEKAIKGVEIFARASNVDISLKAEESLPKVEADPGQIRIVMDNLLDNAVKYIKPAKNEGDSGKKRGRVEVILEKKNHSVYCEIKDNGVGIPKADQKYIFQKFFRSANIMKNQTGGSGLGLYIAKSIVEQAKGKVGFKSQEGKGTSFWFMLPIK